MVAIMASEPAVTVVAVAEEAEIMDLNRLVSRLIVRIFHHQAHLMQI